MEREQPLLLLTKIVLAFVAVNALAGAVALVGFPAWAGPRFFWSIQSPINAALLGGLYLAGAASVTFVVIRNRWESTRFFVPVLVTAGWLITGITLVHRDLFAMDLRFWYWLVVYGVAPLLVIGLYWLQERNGATWEVGEAVRPITRWLAVMTGIVAVIGGVGMIWQPQPVIDLWPWPITPLLVRIFAAWITAFGAGLLWFLVERNWRHLRLLPTLMIAAAIFDLTMVFVHRAAITKPGLSLWLFCGHLIVFGVVGVLLHLLQGRQTSRHAAKLEFLF